MLKILILTLNSPKMGIPSPKFCIFRRWEIKRERKHSFVKDGARVRYTLSDTSNFVNVAFLYGLDLN